MTLFMYGLAFVLGGRQTKVTKILGTMIANQTGPNGGLSERRPAIITGIIAHYAVGLAFASVYHWIWQTGIGQPTFRDGLWLSAASAGAAIILWRLFFAVHPRPPIVNLRTFLPSIGLAHVVFTFGAIAVYRLFL